jgi:hypothetical protein
MRARSAGALPRPSEQDTGRRQHTCLANSGEELMICTRLFVKRYLRGAELRGAQAFVLCERLLATRPCARHARAVTNAHCRHHGHPSHTTPAHRSTTSLPATRPLT